jgi:hypothetical protein
LTRWPPGVATSRRPMARSAGDGLPTMASRLQAI